MFPTTGSLASLVAFLPLFVAAIPNAPAPTPAAHLDKRQNGPNTIGFSLSGTSWRTRSCNTGYFSSSGSYGNCCVNNSCNFLTACVGSTIYYANGDTSTCATTCATGRVLQTVGDQSPLSMFNCQSDWTATQSPTLTSSSTTAPSTSSTTTSESATTSESSSTGSSDASSTSSSTPTPGPAVSSRPVTLTVTNSDGSLATSVSIQAVPLSSDPANPSPTTPGSSDNDSNGGSNAGAIAGGVVGGLAVLALLAAGIFFFLWKRKKAAKEAAAGTTAPLNPDGSGPSSGPAMGEHTYGGPVPAYAQGGYTAYNPHQHQTQDYKMPVAGGGYAEPQGPQILDGTPVQQQRGPSELYGGNVQGPVEMPAQTGYGR